jgi:hypothetical protein
MDESEAGPGAWRSLAIQVTSKVLLMTPTSATISADPTRPDPTRPGPAARRRDRLAIDQQRIPFRQFERRRVAPECRSVQMGDEGRLVRSARCFIGSDEAGGAVGQRGRRC